MEEPTEPRTPLDDFVPAEVVGGPVRSSPPPHRSRLSAFLLILLAIFLGASVLLNILLIASLVEESSARVQEELYEPDRFGRGSDKIAIISVDGVILEGEGFITRQIRQARKDEQVKAVILRVTSPGGTISGSDFIYHRLKEFREETGKPIVVSMGSIAASGGYYVSMAVGDTPRTIFAEPSTWTGSIGVIIPHYNLTGLLHEVGVEEDSIVSHPLKDLGSFTRPMTEQEREILQTLVDQGFERFKDVVKYGRPVFQNDPRRLDEVATGQVFTAQQAKDLGLVDEIGFLEEAVDRAIELSGIDPQDYRVVKYKPEPTLATLLFGDEVHSRTPDLSALLEAASPRAYYLYTWLPAAVSTQRLK